jgi:integrase
LNEYLSLVDYENKPMKFHSHQLRETFAVTHLLNGTSMEDLSQMLSHSSVRITEKYYSPWIPERQRALEQKMTEALVKMGASVSMWLYMLNTINSATQCSVMALPHIW